MKEIIKEINQAIYESMLHTSRCGVKHIPTLEDDLPIGEFSKGLITIARRNIRSEYMANFFTSLFGSLCYVSHDEEYKMILVTKVTIMVSRLYHKNFTTMEDLYDFLCVNPYNSIYKEMGKRLLNIALDK